MHSQTTRYARAWHLVLLAMMGGCQPTAVTTMSDTDRAHGHDHAHSERPQSLAAAISELKDMRDQIRSAMDNDNPESAHAPLHDVGGLLEIMPELAADTDLPEEEWNEIKDESDRLFDAFGSVDTVFHENGDRQAAYEAERSTIDEGIAVLEQKLALLGDASPLSANDHQHAHDDDHATSE